MTVATPRHSRHSRFVDSTGGAPYDPLQRFMSSGAKGDDAPDDEGTGSGARSAAPRYVVRNTPVRPGESAAMSAADTAMAASAGSARDSGLDDTVASGTQHGSRAETEEAADGLVGITLLGRYSVTRKIGQGGM